MTPTLQTKTETSVLATYKRRTTIHQYRANIKSSIIHQIGAQSWLDLIALLRVKGQLVLYRDILRDIAQSMEMTDSWSELYLHAYSTYDVIRTSHHFYPDLDECDGGLQLVSALDRHIAMATMKAKIFLYTDDLLKLYRQYTELGLQLLALKEEMNQSSLTTDDPLAFY